MFWKKQSQQHAEIVNCLDAREIVSQVGEIYADLNDQEKLVKPHSSLPCSWFAVREHFMIAYEAEYPQLSESLKDSYHHVYRELAFFVDDALCNEFNASLSIVAKCRSKRFREIGLSCDEAECRRFIASSVVTIQDRKAIWEDLKQEKTCPRQHLILLAETLSHCGELYRLLWDEWATFANLVSYRKAKEINR